MAETQGYDGRVVIYRTHEARNLREVNDAVILPFTLYGVHTDLLGDHDITIAHINIDQSTAQLLPALAAAFGRVYLPKSMTPDEYREDAEKVVAVSDGFRTCTFVPDRPLTDRLGVLPNGTWAIANPIKLSTLGIQGEDAELIDQPSLGIKGIGAVFDGLTPTDEAVFSLVNNQEGDNRKKTSTLRRLLSHLAPLSPIIVPRILQDDDPDMRVIGGESFIAGRLQIGQTQQLIAEQVDLKFFPTILSQTLPRFAIKEMLRHMRDIGIQRDFGKRFWMRRHNVKGVTGNRTVFEDSFKLAQVVRLVFSQVRARGFTEEMVDFQEMADRFKALEFDPEEYRSVIAPRYRRDFRRMFDAYTRFYRTERQGEYQHVNFSEMHHVIEMNESQFRRYNIAYYFTKDLALAKTGAYMADLDSLDLGAFIHEEELPTFTRRFTAELFKEWIRLMTNLRIASHSVESNPISEDQYRAIEQEEYELLLAEIQNSSTSTITEHEDHLSIHVNLRGQDKQPTGSGFDVSVEKSLFHMRYQG